MSKINSSLLKLLQSLSRQKLLLPFYHAVTDSDLIFTHNLYPPRPIQAFKHDIETLLTYYQPIDLATLIKSKGTAAFDKTPHFHLTFDDGLSNFYYEVAPILKEKNLSATVFLNTNFVDNKNLFFRYKASLLLTHYRKSDREIKSLFQDFIKEKGFHNVKTYLLQVTYQKQLELNQLAELTSYSFQDFLAKEKPYLSLIQIKELVKQGITFGVHSIDHPLFADLSLEEQLKQVEGSMAWLTEKLNLDYKVFSFPFEDAGVSNAFFNSVTLDLSFGTYGIKKDAVVTNLQRISFEYADHNTLRFILKEQLKYLVKKLFGKHIIKHT